MNIQLSKFFRVSIIVLLVGKILLAAKVFTIEHRVTVLEKSLTPHVVPVN
jgi:hypothetical protein